MSPERREGEGRNAVGDGQAAGGLAVSVSAWRGVALRVAACWVVLVCGLMQPGHESQEEVSYQLLWSASAASSSAVHFPA